MFDLRIPRRKWYVRSLNTKLCYLVLAIGVLVERGIIGANAVQPFRCESEEDLDGSTCRVDMLPDAALAEMVYER